MKIRIITPAPEGSQKGNRVTALRWASLLEELGHHVEVETDYLGGACDLLVALHARRSHPSAARYRGECAGCPLVVALTGTDVYQDLGDSPEALQSLEWATRIVTLQPLAIQELPEALRRKARTIYQSAEPPPNRPTTNPEAFEVCVLGHLRPVKDPFRAAEAVRLLPPSSRVRVVQVGSALSEDMAERARREGEENPRYRWLGELPQGEALRRLAGSRLLVLSSILEGGANVISEAVVAGTPVLSSRIPGAVGLLGEEYRGYFEAGDTAGLAGLLRRAETEPAFYQALEEGCARLVSRFHPDREREAWRELLGELTDGGAE